MQLIAEYINYLETEGGLSFNSLRLYKRDLLDFDSFWTSDYPEIEFKDLTGQHLDKFRIWVLNQGKTTAAVNRKLTALRGMWKWLRVKGEVERDPFTQIIRESQFRNKKSKFMTKEQIEVLLDYPEFEIRTKMVLELMYATGLRIGELTQVTLTDIDMENQLLTIPRKGRAKERVVPFNNLTKEYLEKYIEENALTENNRLLFSKRGDSLSEREVFRLIREAAQKAGLEMELSPSVIRNSFIKHMLENGAHEVLIKDLTGQKSFTV